VIGCNEISPNHKSENRNLMFTGNIETEKAPGDPAEQILPFKGWAGI
jgi:hypothetical protein